MNKQEIQEHFKSGDVPTEAQFAEWIERCVIWVDDVSELPAANAKTAGSCYLVGGKVVYRCVSTEDGWKWQAMTSAGGASSYLELTNKPRVEGVTMSGNMTYGQLGVMSDFAKMSSTADKLNDDMIAVIGIRTSDNRIMPTRTTLGMLKKYFVGNSGCRMRMTFGGAQDGRNTAFNTEGRFVAGTSALYINGKRLMAGIDYTEREGMGFVMTDAPVPADRLLFEAVRISDTR